jgi:tetratricopeptide (TPR) repeat protein
MYSEINQRIYLTMFKSILSVLTFLSLAFILSGCVGDRIQENAEEKDIPTDRLSELKVLADQEPDNAEIFNELALYYLSQDNFNDALHNVNKSLQLEPENIRFLVTLSDIYLMMGDAERAQLTLYRAMELEPGNADIYVGVARLQVYTEDYTRAFENLRKALELDRSNSKAYFWRGLALLENGDTAKAISDWQLAVANDQESFEGYFQLGLLMAERNDRFAFDYLDHALRLAPADPEIMYDIGLAFQEIGRFNKASETYEKILAIDSCFHKAWYNIGYIQLVEMEAYELAVDNFSKALRCNTDYVDAIYNRGLAHELLGNYIKARSDYQEALKISVNYARAIEGLNRLDQLQ